MPRIKNKLRIDEKTLIERSEAENGRIKDQVTHAGIALLMRVITSENEMDYRNDLAHLRFFSMCLLDVKEDIVSKQHKSEYISKHNI